MLTDIEMLTDLDRPFVYVYMTPTTELYLTSGSIFKTAVQRKQSLKLDKESKRSYLEFGFKGLNHEWKT